MIETTILDFINDRATFPAFMEVPEDGGAPPFVVIERTGGGEADHVLSATLAIQSYGRSLLEAAQTNETVKALMADAAALPEIGRIELNNDYNFTDTTRKQYRYQAVFDITYY